MKIELDLNQKQLGELLSALESCIGVDLEVSNERRGFDFLLSALSQGPSENCYTVVQLAPIYRQLVTRWKKHDTAITYIFDLDERMKFARSPSCVNAVAKILDTLRA